MINLMRVGDLRDAEKYPVHQIFCNDMVDAEDVIINVFMNFPLSLFTSSRKRNTRGFIGGYSLPPPPPHPRASSDAYHPAVRATPSSRPTSGVQPINNFAADTSA